MDSDFVYHQGGVATPGAGLFGGGRGGSTIATGTTGAAAHLWDPHASEALGMLLDWHPSALDAAQQVTLHDRDHHNVHTSQLSRPPPRIPHRAACKVADAAQSQLSFLQTELRNSGLLLATPTDPDQVEPEAFGYVGPTNRARVLAPFDKREVVLGPRLGSGGFASVYEVHSFRLLDPKDNETAHKFGDAQLAARTFLQQHAAVPVGPAASTADAATSSSRDHHHHPVSASQQLLDAGLLAHRTQARYAVKHLRYSLVEHVSKYEKAAIDLALEAQLLLALDHPNVVQIRGWTQHGTHSFRGGSPGDYFLILDCLPEQLDDRFFVWRQQIRTYRNKKSPWWTTVFRNKVNATHRREKYDTKLQSLLAERLQVAHDLSSALEYLHDKRIVHRDIKSSNIGFDADGVPKIFDLGLARLLPPESECFHDGYVMSRVGTKSNMAPEVADKRPYDAKADVYSFGIVLWEILSLSTAGEYFRMIKRKRGNAAALTAITTNPANATANGAAVTGAGTAAPGAVRPPRSISGTTTITPPSVEPGMSPPPVVVPAAVPAPRPRSHNRRHHDYSSSAPVPDGTPGFAEGDCVLPLCPCWPTNVQDLVKRCLAYRADDRPTMAEVRHELFQLVQGLRGENDLDGAKKAPTRQRRRSTFRIDLTAALGGGAPTGTHASVLGVDPAAAVAAGGAAAETATTANPAVAAPTSTARRASHSERLAAAVRKAAAAAGPSSGRSNESSTAFASVSLSLDPS